MSCRVRVGPRTHVDERQDDESTDEEDEEDEGGSSASPSPVGTRRSTSRRMAASAPASAKAAGAAAAKREKDVDVIVIDPSDDDKNRPPSLASSSRGEPKTKQNQNQEVVPPDEREIRSSAAHKPARERDATLSDKDTQTRSASAATMSESGEVDDRVKGKLRAAPLPVISSPTQMRDTPSQVDLSDEEEGPRHARPMVVKASYSGQPIPGAERELPIPDIHLDDAQGSDIEMTEAEVSENTDMSGVKREPPGFLLNLLLTAHCRQERLWPTAYSRAKTPGG